MVFKIKNDINFRLHDIKFLSKYQILYRSYKTSVSLPDYTPSNDLSFQTKVVDNSISETNEFLVNSKESTVNEVTDGRIVTPESARQRIGNSIEDEVNSISNLIVRSVENDFTNELICVSFRMENRRLSVPVLMATRTL